MAKYSNTIYFSLDKESREKLETYSSDGESLGLTAKKLILEMIRGDRQSSPMSPDLGDRLGELEDRLEQVEETQGLSPEDLDRLAGILRGDLGLGEIGDRLETIESRLEKFEKHLDWAKREILDQRGKIKSLESDAYWNGDKKPETTIMIQKQPLPLAVEIQRTHEEVAQDWGKTLATVKRWAKDPDKWPEGWLWDGDKNFWVKEV